MDQFTYVKRGYDPEEVDKYITTLEQVIKSYKDKDNAIKNAIITSQVTADNVIRNAQMQADSYKVQIAEQLVDIRAAVDRQRMSLQAFQESYANMVRRLMQELEKCDMGDLFDRLDEMETAIADLQGTTAAATPRIGERDDYQSRDDREYGRGVGALLETRRDFMPEQPRDTGREYARDTAPPMRERDMMRDDMRSGRDAARDDIRDVLRPSASDNIYEGDRDMLRPQSRDAVFTPPPEPMRDDRRDPRRDPGRDMLAPAHEPMFDSERDMMREPARDMMRDQGRDYMPEPTYMPEQPRDTMREPSRDMMREPSRDMMRDPGRDFMQEPAHDVMRDPGRDMRRDPGPGREAARRDLGRDIRRDSGRDVRRDTGRDMMREAPRDTMRMDPREPMRDTSRPPFMPPPDVNDFGDDDQNLLPPVASLM